MSIAEAGRAEQDKGALRTFETRGTFRTRGH